jgi:hypothetical protein
VGDRTIRCALLAHHPYDWTSVSALTCPGIEFLTLTPSAVGLTTMPNPFGLYEDDQADVVLLVRSWYEWLNKTHPGRFKDVMRTLERWSVVGLDGIDEFALGFPPSAMERFTTVIKPQGLYRDRDLYNYRVGCLYPGAIWAAKAHPRQQRFRNSDLDKLRLSLPCFALGFPAVRSNARRVDTGALAKIGHSMSRPERTTRDLGEALLVSVLAVAAGQRRVSDVHLVGGLTHVQRLEAIQLLTGLSGKRGIVNVPDWIAGTEHGLEVPAAVRRELVASARPYMCAPTGRIRYLLNLSRHRVGLAPPGYGELTFRHAEVLRAGAALVCPNLSHVELMFPLKDRENVVFCRPDLSDLRPTVEELLHDDSLRERIAKEGRRSFISWARGWRDHVYAGMEAHIRAAVGADNPTVKPSAASRAR